MLHKTNSFSVGARGITFVMLMVFASMSSNAFAQSNCDRACLRSLLDQYLTAVVDNDPGAAPIVEGIRQTENAINFAVGNGPWTTVTGLGDVQRKYFDPVSGQAAYYGAVIEGRSQALATIRVRVENRQITEAEWYVARADGWGIEGPGEPGGPPVNLFNVDYLTANPSPDRVVPESQRSDRATLERIVDSYFDAITSHDRSVALVHPGCGRAENGSPAPAGRFLPPANPNNPPAADRDCVSGVANFDLQMVVARRTPVIDVEAQAVLTFAVFIRRPGSHRLRNAFSEWFFIDNGRIRTIYTAAFYPPPDLAVPNWPPYDGNWPLPSSIATESAPQ